MVDDNNSKGNGGIYSHSRLWLYESCPEFYRLKYIDKKLPPMPTAMPLFLGSIVHDALEWLYHQVKHREVEVDDLIEYFTDKWTNTFDENVKVENGDEVDAYNRGVRFLMDYYTKNKPFNQKVLAIEHKIIFPLDSEGKYKIQGFIDRLDLGEDGTYEVHDYKTNQSMKKKEDFENDRQLALYDIGLRETFGKDIKVRLIWHFLNFNKQVTSERTFEQLEKLKSDTLELIKKIESTTEWSSCNSRYCDWCNYKKENGITYEQFIEGFDF
jgi:putative RecB family exonuclease